MDSLEFRGILSDTEELLKSVNIYDKLSKEFLEVAKNITSEIQHKR